MPEFEFRHDWTMLYQRQNWYDFTFVHLMVENDVNLGQFEVYAAILGLHLRVVWDTGETPARRRLVSERDRFLADFNTDEQETDMSDIRDRHRRFLWDLLDDIDTLDDACKDDDRAFRDRVREVQKRRFEISTSDGYSVSFHSAE